jgi:hypothetical protein
MDQPVEKWGFVWQPLTPGGIAGFARAPLRRLLLVQLVVSIFCGAMLAWFVRHSWFPVVVQAIQHLPEEGEIRNGQLQWARGSPEFLGENRFLALAVDLKHEGQVRSPAHLAVEFGTTDFKIFSLLGYVRGVYPRSWRIAFNRNELIPWWGAWTPALLTLVIAGTVLSLMLCWALLASLCFLPAWIIAYFTDRGLHFRASWRIAGAALMPAALFLAVGILVYGLGVIDLIGLFVMLAIHFVVGWVFLALALRKVPRNLKAVPAQSNPFATR